MPLPHGIFRYLSKVRQWYLSFYRIFEKMAKKLLQVCWIKMSKAWVVRLARMEGALPYGPYDSPREEESGETVINQRESDFLTK